MASLLPPSSTPFEIAMEGAMAAYWQQGGITQNAITTLQDLKSAVPASVIPWLIREYGLEEIEEFFALPALALREGMDWQRARGTPKAVSLALSWIGYKANLREQWYGRRRWHTFELGFSTPPAGDTPDLSYISRIAQISAPARCHFRRGFSGGASGYDVPAATGDTMRLDGAILDHDSGIDLYGARWSFGETHEIDHAFSEEEGILLGNWIPDSEGASLRWQDMAFPWESADFAWNADGQSQRAGLMAGWFTGRPLYLAFMRLPPVGDGAILGYRRCLAVSPVSLSASGPYAFGGAAYKEGGGTLYAAARTDFSDADQAASAAGLPGDGASEGAVGEEAAENGVPVTHVALSTGDLAAHVPAGKLWIGANDLMNAAHFAATPLAIRLRRTRREHIKFLVRF